MNIELKPGERLSISIFGVGEVYDLRTDRDDEHGIIEWAVTDSINGSRYVDVNTVPLY